MPNVLLGTAALVAQLKWLRDQALEVSIMREIVKAGIKPAFNVALATMPVGSVPHKTYKGRMVQPGFAKTTLHVATHQRPDKQAVLASLGVAGEAYYEVQFIELGTSKMAAHPWLRPAMFGTGDAQLQILVQKFRERVEKVTAVKS